MFLRDLKTTVYVPSICQLADMLTERLLTNLTSKLGIIITHSIYERERHVICIVKTVIVPSIDKNNI